VALGVLEERLGPAHSVGAADGPLDALPEAHELARDVPENGVVALGAVLRGSRPVGLPGPLPVPALDAAHVALEGPLGFELGAHPLDAVGDPTSLVLTNGARLLGGRALAGGRLLKVLEDTLAQNPQALAHGAALVPTAGLGVDERGVALGASLTDLCALKSPAAKLRTLRATLDAIRGDDVPDELQADQIRWLEEAIAELERGS
jgi:hypothetical protein